LHRSERCLIITNPTSGREKAPRYLPLLDKVLSMLYRDVSIKLTEGPGDATRFAKEAALQGIDIVSMGGDGTLNEVINGIIPAEKDINFGFIPLGTVNDLARALSIPLNPKDAILMLAEAETKRIDIGRINDLYFVNVAAAGIIPEAVSEVSIQSKTLLGANAYYIKGLRSIHQQKVFHFTVDDGETKESFDSPMIVAMLTDSAGSFHNILPPEMRGKHAIKLCIFKDYDLFMFLKQAPKLLAGLQLGPDVLTVKLLTKARISVSDNEDLWTNVDGDHGPSFPVDLSILPERLSVFVPSEDKASPKIKLERFLPGNPFKDRVHHD
jgi:diacylglycerol kinase (ATP)